MLQLCSTLNSKNLVVDLTILYKIVEWQRPCTPTFFFQNLDQGLIASRMVFEQLDIILRVI